MTEKRNRSATLQDENKNMTEVESVVSTNQTENGKDDTIVKEQHEVEQVAVDSKKAEIETPRDVEPKMDNDRTVACSTKDNIPFSISAQNVDIENLKGTESDSKTPMEADLVRDSDCPCKDEGDSVESVSKTDSISNSGGSFEPKKDTVMLVNVSNDGSEDLMSSPLSGSDTVSTYKIDQYEEGSKDNPGNDAIVNTYDPVLPCLSNDTGESTVLFEQNNEDSLNGPEEPQFHLLASFCGRLGKILALF